MNNRLNRLISLLLTAVMLLCMFPASANAENTTYAFSAPKWKHDYPV